MEENTLSPKSTEDNLLTGVYYSNITSSGKIANIATLLDENGNQLLPRTPTKAVYNPDGTTWQDAMDAKAEKSTLDTHLNDNVRHITAEERTVWNAKSDKPYTVELNLTATGWAGAEAPYTQTVAVQGMDADTNGTGEVSDTATDEQWNAAIDADLRKSGQTVNSITFKAYGDKPAVDIPYSLLIVG